MCACASCRSKGGGDEVVDMTEESEDSSEAITIEEKKGGEEEEQEKGEEGADADREDKPEKEGLESLRPAHARVSGKTATVNF